MRDKLILVSANDTTYSGTIPNPIVPEYPQICTPLTVSQSNRSFVSKVVRYYMNTDISWYKKTHRLRWVFCYTCKFVCISKGFAGISAGIHETACNGILPSKPALHRFGY